MNWPTYRAFYMWLRNYNVFIRLFWSIAPGFVIEPVVLLVALGFGFGSFIGDINGQPYMEFIIPGVIASYAMTSATFECTYNVFFRMDYRKTYDSILATPMNVSDVVTGEVLWGATRSIITACIILLVAALFGIIHSPWALLAPIFAVLEGIMFASIGIFFASIVPSIYSFNYYFTLFIGPMTFFSGAFFPVSSFPEAVQAISNVVPLTPAVSLIRGAVSGDFSGVNVVISLLAVIGVSAAFYIATLFSMKRRVME
ncbi:MAG: ABC transporter permease [Dehalococcoides mccartyi]|nr:ABC transporter permease [Dehalococcoides mccartyi]OBW63024.1 MAG: ABC transporter permease [Dehalococcoides mccartyi]